MELPDQITATHQPDVAARRGPHHLFVDWRHIP